MSRYLARQQLSLIETTPPSSIPVQRHRDNHVIPVVDRQSAIHQPRQAARQRTHAGILEQVDQTTQRAVVKTEARGTVETEQAGPAQSADAIGIERKAVLKRGVTVRAEIIGFERRGCVQAVTAYRDACKSN